MLEFNSARFSRLALRTIADAALLLSPLLLLWILY
jgi:hypothetical protein